MIGSRNLLFTAIVAFYAAAASANPFVDPPT